MAAKSPRAQGGAAPPPEQAQAGLATGLRGAAGKARAARGRRSVPWGRPRGASTAAPAAPACPPAVPRPRGLAVTRGGVSPPAQAALGGGAGARNSLPLTSRRRGCPFAGYSSSPAGRQTRGLPHEGICLHTWGQHGASLAGGGGSSRSLEPLLSLLLVLTCRWRPGHPSSHLPAAPQAEAQPPAPPKPPSAFEPTPRAIAQQPRSSSDPEPLKEQAGIGGPLPQISGTAAPGEPT